MRLIATFSLIVVVGLILLTPSPAPAVTYVNACGVNTTMASVTMTTSQPMAGIMGYSVTRFVHFSTTNFQSLVCCPAGSMGMVVNCSNGGTFKGMGTNNTFSLAVFAKATNPTGGEACTFNCGFGSTCAAGAPTGSTVCTVVVTNGLPVELLDFSVSDDDDSGKEPN
jgi:hypothetical protein